MNRASLARPAGLREKREKNVFPQFHSPLCILAPDRSFESRLLRTIAKNGLFCSLAKYVYSEFFSISVPRQYLLVSGGDDTALHAAEFNLVLNDNDVTEVHVTREVSEPSAHTSSVTGNDSSLNHFSFLVRGS